MISRWSSSTRRYDRPFTRLLALVVLMAGLPAPAVGQEDFRNTDRGRPLLTEDAYPIELREWESELGVRGAIIEGGTGSGAELIGGLKTGLFLNTEVGVEVATALRQQTSDTEFGFGGVGAHVMYGVVRETWGAPALAFRAEAHSPGSGGVGIDGWTLDLTGVATRSFDRLRLHANAGHRRISGASGRDHWHAGLAVDYPIGLFSRLVMADVYAEIPVEAGRTRVWFEAGTRWQLSNASVLDFGLATRVDRWDAGRANVELVVGFSRAFGVPAAVGVPPYPNPALE